MRKSIKEAIGTTIQDMLDSGFQSSFTKKELNSLGVKIPDIVITSAEIKGIRKKTNLSQAVFAKCQFIICQAMGAREKSPNRINKSITGTSQ
jgi:DNA-binding transcriptional regulator YiaG